MKQFLVFFFTLTFLSTSALAVSPKERVWVMGQLPGESRTNLHILNQNGIERGNILGFFSGGVYKYSVNGPLNEFWYVAQLGEDMLSVRENGLFTLRDLPFGDGVFYIHDANTLYMAYQGGLSKVTIVDNVRVREEKILNSSQYGDNTPLSIAVDELNRIYIGAWSTLYRYDPATQELLQANLGAQAKVIDTYQDEAFVATGSEILKVSTDFLINSYAPNLTPVDFLAVDAAGNVIAASQGVLWQVAPDETVTQFSPDQFSNMQGLAITHFNVEATAIG